MSTTESGYRSLIHDISQDLSGEDARGLRFLAGLPSMRCQCGAGGGQLGLLQALQERGMCSQFNLNTLISLLREIGRHDLASKCQQFVPGVPPVLDEPRPSLNPPHHTPSSPLNPPQDRALSSPPQDPLPPTTPQYYAPLRCRPLHHSSHLTSSASRLQDLASGLFRQRHHVRTGSCEEGLDSFHIVDDNDLLDYPGHTHQGEDHTHQEKTPKLVHNDHPCHTHQGKTPTPVHNDHRGGKHSKLLFSRSFESALVSPIGRRQRDRTWTTPGDRGVSNSFSASQDPFCDRTLSWEGPPTFSWAIKRSNFIDPIFKHSNKVFEKKFQMRVGAKEDRCGLTFVLKLYPNGVNWDQDSSSTLQVEVLSSLVSHCVLYCGVTVLEDRTTSQQVLTQRRKVCRLQEERKFLLSGFLSHEVLKTSQAKILYLLFRVQLSYLLGQDWVCIGAENNLGCVTDQATV